MPEADPPRVIPVAFTVMPVPTVLWAKVAPVALQVTLVSTGSSRR